MPDSDLLRREVWRPRRWCGRSLAEKIPASGEPPTGTLPLPRAASTCQWADPLRVTVVLVTVTAGRLGVGEPPGCRARGPRGSLSLKVGGREAPAGREQTAAAARAGRASDSDEPERGIHHNASQSKWRPPLPDSE